MMQIACRNTVDLGAKTDRGSGKLGTVKFLFSLAFVVT